MLKIENDGKGWDGTFGLAVEFIIKDILSDGAPFTATISHEVDDRTIKTETVVIASVDAGQVKLIDGTFRSVNLLDITMLEVD